MSESKKDKKNADTIENAGRVLNSTAASAEGIDEMDELCREAAIVAEKQRESEEAGGDAYVPITACADGDAEAVADFGRELKDAYDEICTSDAVDSNIMRENANINADTPMGMMLKIGSESEKKYVQRYLMSSPFARAHKNGYIHVHDLDFYASGTTTCTQIDIDALFERGFSTGHGHLRTPNDIQSYAALACIAIQSNQNDQHGGQSIPNFDYAMSKGVAKTFIKEYKLAMMAAVEMRTINPALDGYQKIKSAVENLIGIAEGTTGEKASLAMSPTYAAEERKGVVALGFDDETAEKIQKYSYETALRETDKKTYQAMEALVHNLNTMQCLPASERIWVKEGESLRLMSMEEIDETFAPGKYEVLSINKDGKCEWKHITASQRKDNNRRLVTLTTRAGQKVTVTDNHTVMTIDADADGYPVCDVLPEKAKWLLSPREVEYRPVKNTICVDDYGVPRKDTPFIESHAIMSEELAELLGIYAGDGYIAGGSQIALSVAFKIEQEYLQDLVNRALGIDTSVYKVEVLGKYPEYRFNVGTRFCRMLADVVGDKSHNKHVPAQILLAPDYIKIAFLNGYFSTDGRHTTKYQSAYSVSEELTAGVAFLIHSLGELPHRSLIRASEKNAARKDMHDVSLGHRACCRIGVATAESDTAFEIPRYDLSMIWNEIKKEKGYGGVPRRTSSHNTRYEELGMFLNEHGEVHKCLDKFLGFFCTEVTDIQESNSGDEYVYDISVEDNENFMTRDCIFVHNSRAGSQVPFSSINYGTDTTAEGRMVIRNVLEATQAGLGHGETAIFPVQIFKVKDGVNYREGDPNYDLFKLAMETSARRLFPNFEFLDAPFNLQYYKPGHPETEVATMGCRTRVMGNVFDPEREIAYGRGNLSFTSINLPRIAIESHGSLDEFFRRLEEMLALAVAQLDERVAYQMRKHVYNFPMLMGQGVWIDSEKLRQRDEIGDILLHGSISVGFIGLAETLVSLTGHHHGESAEAQALGLKIVGFMRSYLDRLAKERKRNYTLLATPAEGLSGRFVNMDRKRYGVIPGVTDREYYTNSFHVPVYQDITAYDKIHIEAPYHNLCNAGHISYVELDGMPSKNMESYESVIRCMHDAGIGYASVNFPLDNDPVCGYRGVIKEGERCPRCGRDENEPVDNDGTIVAFTRIRRVTGYLSGDYKTRFNDAKQAEVRDRVKHGVGPKAMEESTR